MYRVGIIGLGQIASDIDDDPARDRIWSHAGAYARHPKTEIVAVCDVDEEKISKFSRKWDFQTSYINYIEMLEKESLDIVSVCTPIRSHSEIVKNISTMGIKAVFCEKPLAESSYQAQQMIDACQANNLVLAVNFMRRWEDDYLVCKKQMDDGLIGKLHTVVGYGCTALMMSTSHLIDLMLFFAGKPQWIIGKLQKDYIRKVDGAPDPGGIAFIEFKNGASGFLKGVSANPKRYMFELDILGSEGRIRISDDGRFKIPWKFKKQDPPSGTGYETLAKGVFPKVNTRTERMFNAIDDIIYCIENGGEPKSNGFTARDNLKFIECIKFSDKGYQRPVFF